MSYRAPPAVLPSRRPILSPAAREGVLLSCESTDNEVERAVSDAREDEARGAAVCVPCPAFTIGPDLRGPRSPRPPRDLSA